LDYSSSRANTLLAAKCSIIEPEFPEVQKCCDLVFQEYSMHKYGRLEINFLKRTPHDIFDDRSFEL
jgi:hypothetical protein